MIRLLILIVLSGIFTIAQAQTTSPDKPVLPVGNFSLENIPESEINIPIQIDLKPFYSLADKKVDTLFTSPGYPNSWVQEGCDTRYKYSFRRGPLQFDFQKTSINISFTGYYKIIGSTRACVNGVAISPWTPECKCGFDEGERRVNVSYTINLTALTNYTVKMEVVRNEPVPIDKCTVCFWGQDITPTIMKALKKELDVSKADLEKSYGRIDLKPQFQMLWHQLNTPYNVNNMGWLQINPQKIRLNRLFGSGDKLNINLGLSAKPVLKFEKPNNPLSPVPSISSFSRNPGFNIYVDAVLNYDSLSAILNKQIVGKEYEFRKAFVRKKFIFQECQLMGSQNERLIVKVKFTGSDNGYFYVTGKPEYDEATKTLAIKKVEFDVKSKDALLKTADWLFSKKITGEIEKMAKYDLSSMINDAQKNISNYLNSEFIKGIKGIGNISKMTISGIHPQPNQLMVRAYAGGSFAINVSSINFSF